MKKSIKIGYYVIKVDDKNRVAKWNGSYWEVHMHTQDRAPEDVIIVINKSIINDEQ